MNHIKNWLCGGRRLTKAGLIWCVIVALLVVVISNLVGFDPMSHPYKISGLTLLMGFLITTVENRLEKRGRP